MKPSLSAIQTLALTGAVLLLLAGTLRAEEPITIAINAWPPYIEQGSRTKGLATEVVLAALKKVGVKAKIEIVPWARALDGVKHGRFTASYPWYETPERRTYALFSSSILESRNVFFYRRDRLGKVDYKKLTELQGYRIAGMLGYFYEHQFAEAELEVIYVKSSELAFKMLQAGRADLVPQDEIVGWRQITTMFPESENLYAVTRTALREAPGYMLVSKKHPAGKALLEKFERGLREIKRTGEYQAIIKKYHYHDMVKP